MTSPMRAFVAVLALVLASVATPVADVVSAQPAPEGGGPTLTLDAIATLNDPIAMASRVGTTDLYVAQRAGLVRALHVTPGGNATIAPAPVVDLRAFTDPGPGERGLLGLTFNHSGRKLYVHYTNLDGNTRIYEYAMSAGGTGNRVVPASRRLVLQLRQPFSNHNGGEITFGPDRRLYVALGDGGGQGDPSNNGQNLNTLLGKILRINPAPSGTANFTTPNTNPFVNQPSRRGAIWLYGVRNPWRISFDRDTGDLYVADVGQGAREEIDVLPADGNERNAGRGVNLGWRRMEGDIPYNGGTPPANHTPPVFTYSFGEPCRAVIGGYVYRGAAIPSLEGTYLFGDFCTGVIDGIVVDGTTVTDHFTELGIDVPAFTLQAFGQGRDGELYVLGSNGTVSRIED